METLNEITALAVADNVANRESVLRLMELGVGLKRGLLRQLEVKELHFHPVYKRIERLNFWPWSGMLENVVKEVGKDHIVEHWSKCVTEAQEDCKVVSELMSERKKQSDALDLEKKKLQIEERKVAAEERKLSLLERTTGKAKKKLKKLLGMGSKEKVA
jgi:hypothetical protein